MIQAQRIALTNSAGVALSFSASAGPYLQSGASTLLVTQSATVDLAAYPFPEGLTFGPHVVVDADARHQPPPEPEPVQFTMNGRTAHYSVHGTIWDWTIEADSVDPPSGRPDLPGFPDQVPLNLLPFLNWDHQIAVPAVPTCAPRTPDDVAAVCNWARVHGYSVRPRGVMHGWSPLTFPTAQASEARVVLVDLTKAFAYTDFLPAGDGLPNRVRAGAGTTLLHLLTALEEQPGGQGSAPGFSFPHTPAPGNLTVGGMLAIDAHGTAVPTPPGDAFAASYGSMSNQVVELVVVAADPSDPQAGYGVRTIPRTAPEAKALLTHLGRALVLEATLQVVDNYNLRCRSITDLPAATLFAAPTPGAVPPNSFADFLARTGRVEVIWFPFSDNPWLHTWQVAPTQPAGSRAVGTPYNYPFADYVPDGLQQLIAALVDGAPSLTPVVGQTAALVTANGLDGKNLLGVSGSYPISRDIWGASKNSLLYIQDTTLRVTANGYAVHLRRSDVQQAVHDLTSTFTTLLTTFAGNDQYPVNSALEIRVTGLDDPSTVGVAGAESPVISALTSTPTDRAAGWDVAVWFDVLTIPGTPHANAFYTQLEAWLLERFSGNQVGRLLPEWSKGWAYTESAGPWTSTEFLAHVRSTLSEDRSPECDWAWEASTLKAMDAAGLFTNPFLETLFVSTASPT